jgi:hypothetical protein
MDFTTQDTSSGSTLQAAKAAILAESEKLRSAGVTFVAMHFDGSGDEGVSEEVKCYSSGAYEHEVSEAIEYDTSHLHEHFEALVPFGYEIGCGGFGDIVLDVAQGTIKVIRNDRFEDYSTSSYEV